MIIEFLDLVDYPCLSLAPGQVTSHHFWGGPTVPLLGGCGPPQFNYGGRPPVPTPMDIEYYSSSIYWLLLQATVVSVCPTTFVAAVLIRPLFPIFNWGVAWLHEQQLFNWHGRWNTSIINADFSTNVNDNTNNTVYISRIIVITHGRWNITLQRH